MGKTVLHSGIVTGASDGMLKVRLLEGAEECGGCAIASVCSKQTEIDVAYPHASADMVRKRVTVEAQTSALQGVAVLVAVPLVLLVLTLVFLIQFGVGQGLAALLALVAVAVWYLIIYLYNRGRDNAVFRVVDVQ